MLQAGAALNKVVIFAGSFGILAGSLDCFADFPSFSEIKSIFGLLDAEEAPISYFKVRVCFWLENVYNVRSFLCRLNCNKYKETGLWQRENFL